MLTYTRAYAHTYTYQHKCAYEEAYADTYPHGHAKAFQYLGSFTQSWRSKVGIQIGARNR